MAVMHPPHGLGRSLVNQSLGRAALVALMLATGPAAAFDPSALDSVVSVLPDWPADQLNRSYCAEVAGLNFHANVLDFYPRPDPGLRPNLELFRPAAPWLSIINHATSRRGVHDRNDIWIARKPHDNTLTFYGNVKFAHKSPTAVTLHDVPAFFAKLLADLGQTEAAIEILQEAGSRNPQAESALRELIRTYSQS